MLDAGAGPVLDWVFRRRLWRPVLAVGLILFTVVNTPLLTLPVGRPGGPVYTIATGPNPDLAAEVGWPGYVDQVGEDVASIPAAQRVTPSCWLRAISRRRRSICSGPRTQ